MRLTPKSFFFTQRKCQMTLLAVVMVFANSVFAQQPVNKDAATFLQAKDLYDKELLLSSRKSFEDYIANFPDGRRRIEARYFIASSAVKLSHDDGEYLMQEFVETNQFHAYTSEAYLELGRHFYKNKNYKKTQQYYTLAQDNHVAFEENDLFQFGYSYFALEDYDSAQKILEKLNNLDVEISKDAFYFQGFMAYQNEDLGVAKSFLKKSFESKTYGIEGIKLHASILYMLSEYKELIDLADEYLINEPDPSIMKMQADSYFELENYRLAALTYADLFKKYAKYRIPESYYRAGFSYLKIQNNENAIDNLKRAALSKDTLSAYASYQLGILYSDTDNLLFASSSFANAAKFEIELSKEASFLHAKSEFDLGNYDKAISLFLDYQKENGNTEYTDLVNEMLSEAYLNTKNYERGIRYIESLSSLSPKIKLAYQRVTFLKGIALYNGSRYHESIEPFKKSLVYNVDDKLGAEAYYYIGEALTRGKKYKDSEFYYQSAIESNIDLVHLQSIYGLAYAYFNLKDYQEAFNTFKIFETRYIRVGSNKYFQDILIRMGDCSYVLKDYESAINYYDKALEESSILGAYIHFQKGLVYRYAENLNNARESFKVVLNRFPNSDKADDALFQIGQIEFESGNNETTIENAKNLIANYPDSKFLPYALLNEAVAQNNLGNQSSTIENYTIILDRFPRHATANSALLGLQELAGAGQFSDFDSYLEKYKKANPNSEALENIEFETARALFYNQNYNDAIKAFDKFRKAYPESALLTEVTYFSADSWYRLDKADKALEYYYQIADEHNYSKFRRIQQRIADLESEKGNLARANNYYLTLKSSDGNFKDTNNANFGLLSNHFSLKNYDSAIYYGEALMEGSRVSSEMSSNAYLLLGKAEYNRGNLNEASDWFLLLINDSPDERGAEAKYYVSKIFYENGDYNNSLKSLFELKDEYRIFDFWVGEAFLLMADNYLATDEVFQATATLNSLVENIQIESIKQKATVKLLEIESNKVQESDSAKVIPDDK